MKDHEKKHHDRRSSFVEEISAEEKRRIKGRHRKHKEVWFGLGMMGIIGWSVSIPTIAGLAVGIWADSLRDTSISWTLTGIFIGLMTGVITAWYWIRHEQEQTEDDDND